ncbi:MAG: transcriptional regulator, TraR/DksA family [Thermoleophilia bacterium]|nr:transcriptional regulator, TraR/DksA family [Thermoleophilia bacterium]
MALTDDQLSELRAQLDSERTRIQGNVTDLSEELSTSLSNTTEEHGLETHIGDQGTDTFLRSRDAALEEHEVRLLAEIDAALERLDAGTYGICEVDGTPIDFERLQALPWARTHAEHAEA